VAYLGIDVGTSSVKAVIVGEHGEVSAQASAPLAVSRPRPLWSEQDPNDWWRAAERALRALPAAQAARVQALGLSGQMHGATLLDRAVRPLRPAILWNDGRSAAECEELEAREPRLRELSGNLAMPGFTAPKLLWVRRHEPEIFARIAKVLLPKDYVRLRLTGDFATDCSDAAGTLWLDVGQRRWSEALIAASGLEPSAMPALFEGSEPTGTLLAEAADALGLPRGIPVAGGAGDQAAGAAGVGVIRPGDAFLSLGTSGVYFVAGARFAPNPAGGVHAFCHCLPGTWHQMSVILSAASCLGWVAQATGARDEAALLAEIESEPAGHGELLFLPYLSGERTPHNDPHARGVFFGLTHETTRAALGRAVLEGVAFAFSDAERALRGAGTEIGELCVIGGGAQSRLWGRILASALDRTLVYRAGGELGPAHGAARLARLAHTGEPPERVCAKPPLREEIDPDRELRAKLLPRLARFRTLYRALRDQFPREAPATMEDR
jgi:xylulokinase